MDNTVGSLTEEQNSLISGSLLGDGYMSCKTNAYLKIGHSIKQKAYVDWKYNYLSSFVLQPPKVYSGNTGRVGYRFWTRSLPIFTRFYQDFYKSCIKKIPTNISLTPLSLAVWFMDDGSRNRKSVYFNTQQFSVDEQRYLLQLLKSQFGLEGNLNKDKQYLRIRLFQESALRLTKIIQPLMPEFMHYKLPL